MVTSEPIEKRVYSIVALQLGLGEEDVQPASTFVDDLGADSLDVVELIMAFEEEFGLEIPDEDVEGFATVQDVVGYLTEKLR